MIMLMLAGGSFAVQEGGEIGRMGERGRGLLDLPLAPRLRYQRGKVPEPPTRQQLARLWIPFGSPLGCQSHCGRRGQLLALRNEDYALLLEPLIRILECLLVDGFEVGQVPLVV